MLKLGILSASDTGVDRRMKGLLVVMLHAEGLEYQADLLCLWV